MNLDEVLSRMGRVQRGVDPSIALTRPEVVLVLEHLWDVRREAGVLRGQLERDLAKAPGCIFCRDTGFSWVTSIEQRAGRTRQGVRTMTKHEVKMRVACGECDAGAVFPRGAQS